MIKTRPCRALASLVSAPIQTNLIRTVTAAVLLPCALLLSSAQAAPGSRNSWGGWSGHGLSVTTTGFFHIEKPAGATRPYIIDPSGGIYFGMGVNTMCQAQSAYGMSAYLTRLGSPDWTAAAKYEWSRFSTGNLFGYSFANPYYMNNAGAWSEADDINGVAWGSPLTKPAAAGGANAPYFKLLRGDKTTYPGGFQPASTENFVLRGLGTTLKSDGTINTKQYRTSVSGDNGIHDPFNPKFKEFVDHMVIYENIAAHKDDANLIGYWIDNEMGFFDTMRADYNDDYGGPYPTTGVHDLRQYIWAEDPAGASWSNPISARWQLGHFLYDKYGTIGALNSAWGTAYSNFTDIIGLTPNGVGHLPPHPQWETSNATMRGDMQDFVHDRLIYEYVRIVTEAIRTADPNHMIGMRLAVGYPINGTQRYNFYGYTDPSTSSIVHEQFVTGDQGWNSSVPYETRFSPWEALKRRTHPGSSVPMGLDYLGFNVYAGHENYEQDWLAGGVNEIWNRGQIPVLISEFSLRANIRNGTSYDNSYPREWTNSNASKADVHGLNGTDDQVDRGVHYQNETSQFLVIPQIIGWNWHAWSDRIYGDGSAGGTLSAANFGFVQARDDYNSFTAGQAWTNLQDPANAANGTYVSDVNANVYHTIYSLNGNSW